MSSSSFTAWRKAGNNMLCWHIVDTATFHHVACHRRSRRVISSYSTDSEWPHRWRHLLNNFGSHQIFPIFHNRPGDAPQKTTHCTGGSRPPHKMWFLGPIQVHTPNGIAIGSAVFARLTVVSNTHTHTHNGTTVITERIVMQTKK